MLTVIDTFASPAGWTGPAGSSFTGNTYPEYIANMLPQSLIIHIPAGSSGQSFVKTFSQVNFPGASSIVLSVWSRQLRNAIQGKPSDYAYKIDFGGGKVFMLPTPMEFEAVDIGLDGWSSATQVKIIPTTNYEDWVILSGCYAVTDEYPLDIYTGVKAGIQQAMAQFVLPVIGTKALTVGQSSIAFTAWPSHVERNATIKITDGVNTEYHQINRWDEESVFFDSTYDGQTIKYAYLSATISLWIPVEYGVLETEALLPAITIWGMAPSPNQDTTDISQIVDTVLADGSAATRRTTFMQKYRIIIDCEARALQTLALLSRIVRWWIAGSVVWVNARKNDIDYQKDTAYIEPNSDTLQIPKVQFTMEIEAHEERAMRIFLPAFTTPVQTITPQSGGVLANVHTGGING